MSLLREILAFFLPRERSADDMNRGGESTQPPAAGGAGTQTGGERDEIAEAARAEADETERLQARIQELEQQAANQDALIAERAEQLVMETLPQLGEFDVAAPPSARRGPSHRPSDADSFDTGEGGGDDDPEAADRAWRQSMEERQARLEAQTFARELNSELDRYSEKYPHMDRGKILNYLARLPEDRANQVRIDRLCEISHKKELARLTGFAEKFHQDKLAELRERGDAPAVPGQGGGPNVSTVKPTSSNATKLFVERMRARGFGG